MSVKNIKFHQRDFVNKGTISFVNTGGVVTIMGKNGAGKSQIIKLLEEEQHEINKVVHKSQKEMILDIINQYIVIGDNKKMLEPFRKIINDDAMLSVNEIKKTFDDFVCDWMNSTIKSAARKNQTEVEHTKLLQIIKINKQKGCFDEEIIAQIDEIVGKHSNISYFIDIQREILEKIKRKFDSTKIIKVDLLNVPTFVGNLQVSGASNNIISFARTKQVYPESSFFLSLLQKSSFDLKQFVKIPYEELNAEWAKKKHSQEINSWLKTCLSQNINFHIEPNFSLLSFEIKIYDENSKSFLNFSDLSNGTQNLLSIISQVSNLSPETIVLIDEPENGMHPNMQKQLRKEIEDLSKKTGAQFIIATHSLYFLKNGFFEEDLYKEGLYIANNDDGIKLYSLEKYLQEKQILPQETLDMIGYNMPMVEYFNFDKTKIVIIVEGKTDIFYLKKIAQILNIDTSKKWTFLVTKTGGATTMLETARILEVVHEFENHKIIFSPDKDIATKHPKIYKALKNEQNYFPIGTTEKNENSNIESMFENNDQKHVTKKGNTNQKMSKAIQFWGKKIKKNDLDEKTIENFENYFQQIEKIT